MKGYAYVVADLIHVGHLKFLEKCKQRCDILTVGVLTDEACMEKKPKPTIPFDERLEMVKALRCVDAVVVQRTYLPFQNAEHYMTDVLFESDSHDSKALKEAKKKFKVIVLPYYEGQSSTKIKEKICRVAKRQHLKV